ncbi:MAG: superoxide dismutase family protein [Bacteroidota bacterium]
MQKFISLALLVFVGIIAGCRGGLIASAAPRAVSALQPTAGSQVSGEVTFSAVGSKLRVVAEVSGLTPGAHGFHIHERGDCGSPDGSSAGGHFNPAGKPHGNPELADHHGGDMPQLIADAEGHARLTAYVDGVRIGEGADGIIGRSVIVHASPDDFRTQPTGNSGARLACGVISLK